MNLLKKIFLKNFLFLLALLPFNGLFAQPVTLSENAKISVLTVGTADELHSLFGHTALRINDAALGLDITYNFGMFNFHTPNFYLKFVKGDLEYQLAVEEFADFMFHYQYVNRTVWEQELNLNPQQKQQIFSQLQAIYTSPDRNYIYKFIDRNCTTKVVDVLNQVLEPKLSYKNPKQTSYRTVLYPYFKNNFYENLGISLIFGTKPDAVATSLFLPLDLLTQLENHNQTKQTLTLYQQRYNNVSVPWWNNIYTLLAFLIGLIFWNKNALNYSFLLLLGVLGIFFIWVGSYSYHSELLWNYNVLLCNPLLVVLVFFKLLKKHKLVTFLSSLLFLSLGIYVVYMFNKPHFLSVLPLVFTVMILVIRYFRISNKVLKANP